jgi:hypothetical protein
MQYLLKQNSKAQAGRHPDTRKVHHRGLWSIGPNEEWCVDGHEKIKNLMEIAVWGIIDKCSSGGCRIDMHNNPQKFGAHLKDRLIHIPDEIIHELLQKYDRPELLQFGTDDTVHLMEQIYQKIGSPKLSARVGWSVVVEMVNEYIELQTGSDEL